MPDPIRLTRRHLIGTGAAGLAASLARLPAAAPSSDVIRRENARPGTTDWQLTFVRTRDRSEEHTSELQSH